VSAPTLSRAVLSLRGDRAPRGSTREYLLHQLVADLFPDRPDRGYLFRQTRERPGGAEVLVLSAEPPRPLDEVPVREWGCAVDVQSKPFAPVLRPGMALDFEVRVNATRCLARPDGRGRREEIWNVVHAAQRADPSGARDPRSPDDVYRAWMERALAGAAEVTEARVTERGEVRARRGDPRGLHEKDRRVLFVAANVVGSLRVADPERLVALAAAGIGRARAFGCGLLCLSRPGSVLPRRAAAGVP
jgi:CRISPR system Cascade subunit CasE